MAHVAFIGLGRMGHGMAGRYLDSGFTVAVWNRSKAKADDLVARGARWASSPADAADGADAVVAMVKAKAYAPDADEAKMIEIVSRPK
jgi:3-hydroxyisobutyrate dehydrogenase-like beta-hydroxyacid dehydrogenase